MFCLAGRYLSSASNSLGNTVKTLIMAHMRSRDEVALSALRQLQAELVNTAKSPLSLDRRPSDWDVLNGCIQRWKQAIGEYERLAKEEGNPERIQKLRLAEERERRQLCILESLKPAQYTKVQLIEAIDKALRELDRREMGMVMKRLKETLDPSRYIPSELASLVKTQLSTKPS